MEVGNIGRYVVSAVVGIVLFLVSLNLFPIIQQNADEYLMVFRDHCIVGESQRFVKAFLVDGNGEIVTRAFDLTLSDADNEATTITCTGATVAMTTPFAVLQGKDLSDVDLSAGVLDEHGEQINGLKPKADGTLEKGTITNGKLSKPLGVTTFLSDLSQLIIRIIPILSVVSFLALSAASLFNYSTQGGTGGVVAMIGTAIGGLIGIVVILNLAPTLFVGLDGAYAWTDPDRLTIMGQFGEIVRLIVRFVPTIFTASILTIVGAQNWLAYKRVQGAM